MANVKVCDVCRKDGKLVETRRHFSVKGKPELKLDVCDEHFTVIKPMKMPEYTRTVYRAKGWTEEMIDMVMKAKV